MCAKNTYQRGNILILISQLVESIYMKCTTPISHNIAFDLNYTYHDTKLSHIALRNRLAVLRMKIKVIRGEKRFRLKEIPSGSPKSSPSDRIER